MNDDANLIRRAAILVATLDAATADELLAQMPAEDAARVRRAVDNLSEVDTAEEAAVLAEFLCHSGAGSPCAAESHDAGGVELRLGAMPPDRGPRAVAEPPRGFLDDTPCADLLATLTHERPQTIAVVISRLSSDRAQRALAALGPAVRADVMRRLIELSGADPEAIAEVERGLHGRVVEFFESEQTRATGLAHVSQLVARAEPGLKRQILADLADHDARLAEQVHPRRLAFADVELLPEPCLAAFVRAVDRQVLSLALVGASRGLVKQVERHLSASEVKSLRRALASLGPTRLADIEEAQRQLARLAEDVALAGRATATGFGATATGFGATAGQSLKSHTP